MADQDKRPGVMQVILSLLIGLALAALVGLGVQAAYPVPSQSEAKLQDLDAQVKAIEKARAAAGGLSMKHEAIYQKSLAEFDAEKKVAQAARGGWVSTVTVILLAVGAILAGASLFLLSRLPLVSNGMMLGGFFTMWYAVYWAFTQSGSSIRFIALAVAGFVTIVVGYLRVLSARKVVEPTPAA